MNRRLGDDRDLSLVAHYLLVRALRIARKLLPFQAKRRLKRFWDPNQRLSVREAAAMTPQNTWVGRGANALETAAGIYKRVSLVIVTRNNMEYTQACLASLLRSTIYPDIEVIVVDNASTDGTLAYLRSLEKVRLIANDHNAGFAAAINQGLRAATGNYMVLLNNDVVFPYGWLTNLIRHLEDPSIGLVVSVTNFSGNESRIDVTYKNLDEMEEFARRYTQAQEGKVFDIHMAAMYCVALRRDIWETVGPLDERFIIGMFEDDDYSHRVRLAGYRVVCAQDSFVHHFGQATFSKLRASEYRELFERNRRLYEQKWSESWKPHRSRS